MILSCKSVSYLLWSWPYVWHDEQSCSGTKEKEGRYYEGASKAEFRELPPSHVYIYAPHSLWSFFIICNVWLQHATNTTEESLHSSIFVLKMSRRYIMLLFTCSFSVYEFSLDLKNRYILDLNMPNTFPNKWMQQLRSMHNKTYMLLSTSHKRKKMRKTMLCEL